MQLPSALRAALDAALDGHRLDGLRESGGRLSRRYRSETRDGRLHLDGDAAVAAYLAARMPATFAAVHASLAACAERRPGFQPQTMLDVGSGPGTALWAAADVFPSLASVTMVEASKPALSMAQRLAVDSPRVAKTWIAADATRLSTDDLPRADLVVLAYVLDELEPEAAAHLVDRLWQVFGDMLVIVEPGTPAGWRRVLSMRERLLEQKANVIAPCPHERACPVVAPDWCHFSQRVERSRTHRLAKEASVPYEDEKFAYLAVSRQGAGTATNRVIAHPRKAKGRIQLKLCTPMGTVDNRLVTRRDTDVYGQARRADWGDALPVDD